MSYPVHQIASEDFPRGLQELPQPPKQLFYRGTLPPPAHKLLAIVGSRAVSDYGREALKTLVQGLKGYPISIISGLALGTDTLAHTCALANNIHTVAIPGSGIDDHVLYPKSNRDLARSILESGGALLSEFDPLFRAQPWSFPQRNRIMAGYSDAVFMLEGAQKSGTLITARMAVEYNKEVLTIPHPLFATNGYGPNLYTKQGATLITKAEDILEALHIPYEIEQRAIPFITSHEKAILDLLPLPRNEIFTNTTMPKQDVIRTLHTLELKGLITETGGTIERLFEEST